MKKRGQVTVFVILGIVILAVVGGFLAFRAGLIDTYLSFDRNRIKVPDEIAPVQQYLESCLEDSVREGIGYMELQGGYLKLDTYKPSSADRFTNVLTPYSGYKVAYWYYEDLDGGGKNQAPTMEIMNKQINEFVKIKFTKCINDLSSFEDEGFDIDVRNIIKSEIIIEDNFVDAVVRAPVNVKKGGVSAKISRHVVILDSSFGELYEKAKKIFEEENENLWLENKTISYLYSYTEDIPHYDVKFSCKSLLWKKSEIAQNYKEILELNIPYYIVSGSVVDSYYKNEPSLIWNLNSDFSGTEVYFEYDRDWPFELDIQGSTGDAVVSQPFPGGIPMIGFCVNNYNFVYSVKHPILITLKDSKSGEEFSFANQVVIRNNQPRKQIDRTDYIQYCGIKDAKVDVDVVSANQGGYYEPVDGASIFYNCMNHQCYLGDSDTEGKFIGKAPVCLGGEFEIVKEGYKKRDSDYDTFGGSGAVSISVERLASLNYEFKVYDMNENILSGPRELNDDEKIVFEIRDLSDNSYSRIGFYPDELQNVELSPGQYQLIARLINRGPAHIEAKEISRCKCPEIPLAGCLCGEENINLEAFDIDDVVTGGAEISFLVERGDLDRSKVIFYVINGGLPSTYDELMITYDGAQLSLGHGEDLKPDFENE